VEFILTSNEPQSIKSLFSDEAIITPMDFDILLCTNKCMLPIERKAIPQDLLASVTDGRLDNELTAMRELSDFYVIVLHGIIKYKQDGRVNLGFSGQHPTKGWTKKGVRNLIRSLEYVEGAHIEYANTDEELVEIIHELQEYFDNNSHTSLRSRKSLYTGFPYKQKKKRVIDFYQGLPDCKYGRAKLLYEAFPTPMKLYKATIDDISNVSGFGPVLSSSIYEFLRRG